MTMIHRTPRYNFAEYCPHQNTNRNSLTNFFFFSNFSTKMARKQKFCAGNIFKLFPNKLKFCKNHFCMKIWSCHVCHPVYKIYSTERKCISHENLKCGCYHVVFVSPAQSLTIVTKAFIMSLPNKARAAISIFT